MIKARSVPSAAYLDGAVFVVGWGVDEVEVLSLPHNQPGQWNLIFSEQMSLGYFSETLCVFNGRILVSSELEDIHLTCLTGYIPYNLFMI